MGRPVEADGAMSITGRKTNTEDTPSVLMESISNIITEISDMFFKHGFAGFFRDAKKDPDVAATSEVETEDDDDEDEDDSAIAVNKKEEAKSRSLRKGVSEARGKKKKEKKQKIKAIIKLLILAVVLYGKITLLLKILAAHLQFKFLLIAAAGLLIQAARFYLDLKKGHHQPQKVIYYEHAQHQHHYDNDEDWGGSSHGDGYWGRAYDDDDKLSAQKLAYRKHKAEESSWF